ncbi:hypothetical protein ACJJTC_003685 [Scirpophaga incertulas]
MDHNEIVSLLGNCEIIHAVITWGKELKALHITLLLNNPKLVWIGHLLEFVLAAAGAVGHAPAHAISCMRKPHFPFALCSKETRQHMNDISKGSLGTKSGPAFADPGRTSRLRKLHASLRSPTIQMDHVALQLTVVK